VAVIEPVPIATNLIKASAIAELEHISRLVSAVSPDEWSRPSAVAAWTVGDVVAHLDLFIHLYDRFLGSVLMCEAWPARIPGWLAESKLVPVARIFDTVNGAIPRAVRRLLVRDAITGQLVAGAERLRVRLQGLKPCPDSRSAPESPHAFYLGEIVNELAIHAWDIESVLGPAPALANNACSVLPLWYWANSRLMFRPQRKITGTVQVLLSNPPSAMWWSIAGTRVVLGCGINREYNAEIRGPSSDFLLSIAGRLHSPLTLSGDVPLAHSFLRSWHLV
jgi:uncharacterized protein (TIGR03083 family)